MRSDRSPKSRSGGGRARAAAAGAGRPGVQPSLQFLVVIGLLFALPIFFTPGQLVEEFEFTKVTLLVTGALVLAAWWIAAESSRATSAGFAKWARLLPDRIASAMRRDPLGAAVALFALSAAASTVVSVRPALSLFGAPQSHAGLRTLVALAAVFYASRSLASNPVWIRRVAQAAGAGAAVATAYALIQIARLDPIQWHRQSAFEGAIRAGSTVGHANTLSAYLTMCLPLIVWLASRGGSRAARVAWLTLAASSLFVIAVSLSRGAWLGVLAVAVAAFLLALASTQRLKRSWLATAFATGIVVVLFPLLTPMRGPFLDRARQLTDLSAPTSRTRVELWRAGIRMVEDHPALGVGVDAYLAAFPRYRTSRLTELEWGGTPAKAHSDAIQILATQGILGGLAALAIALFAARAVWRVARRGSPEARGAAVAAGAALVGYAVPSLVGFATVATSSLAAALAGWAARAAWLADAEQEAGGSAHTSGATASPRSVWHFAVGAAVAGAVWLSLVAKPLRAEISLAEGLRYPAGSRQREDLLARAAATAPWDPRYYTELGRSLFYEGLVGHDPDQRWDSFVRARGALMNSVRAAPEDGDTGVLLASVASAQAAMRPQPNSMNEVRQAFLRAVALDPLNPTVLVAAERGFLASGLDEDAREMALRCATAYPDYAPPLADLGSIALNQGRTAAAAETLRLAVRRQWRGDTAGAANAWNDLARASLTLGEFGQARDAADSALAYNPGLADAFGVREAAKRALSQGVGGRKPGRAGSK